MANDIDLWNDAEELEEDGFAEESELLFQCFNAQFNEGDEEEAERLKEKYIEKFGKFNYY